MTPASVPANPPAAPVAPSPRRRVFSVIGGIVFAVAPWASFGIATPVAFAAATVAMRSWLLALSTAVYSAAWITMFATAGSEPGSTAYTMFSGGLLTLWLLAGLHAVVLAPRLVRTVQHRRPAPVVFAPPEPQPDPAAQVEAETRAEMANHPVLREALQRQTQRRLARELRAADPSLAAELGIGRPDLGRGYEDGGLVDVNAVPATVLAELPGFDPAMAERVVAARERYGEFHSPDELVVYADVPNQVAAELADRLLFTRGPI